MSKDENLLNMESCDIPKCPLDIESELRVELPEDKQCPNWRFLGKRLRRNRVEGRKCRSVKDIVLSIGKLRKQSEKCPIPSPTLQSL